MLLLLLFPLLVNSIPDVDLLTNHFFYNLKEDPRLAGNDFNKLKNIVDEQVENYLSTIQQILDPSSNERSRRSLTTDTELIEDNIGVYVLNGFKPTLTLNVSYPREILLFSHVFPKEVIRYALILEGKESEEINTLSIFKFTGDNFNTVHELKVLSSTKVGLYTTSTFTFITIVGNNKSSGIFIFTPEESLQKIQNLNVENPTSVSMWEKNADIFLAITEKMDREIEVPIYRWLGKHFDEIQRIKTNTAMKLTPFNIHHNHFLAIANFENSKGDTNIYSEIFKYDFHLEKFITHQKLLTNAAMDIKHFYFKNNNLRSDFLIVANLYEIQLNADKNYLTDSIIYKYVDGYFIPIQSFKLSGASHLLPITGPNGEFLLLIACKFEGVKAFQYNGWKFIESEVQFTQQVFSTGVQSLHSYLFNNRIIIVIANENSHGLTVSAFEPIFNHKNMLKEFQDETLLWCTEKLKNMQELDMKEMKKKVDEAPKHDQNVLLLPASLTFSDQVHIGNLRMFDSNSTDSIEKLDELNQRLNESKLKFDNITQISQTSLHTLNTNVFRGNLHVEELGINVDNFFENVITETINNVKIDELINNAIDITKNQQIEQLPVFDTVFIKSQINPFVLNDRLTKQILKKSNLQLKHLIVDGEVVLNKGLDSLGEINHINFTSEYVLLKNRDQKLKGDFQFLEINTKTLEANQLKQNTKKVELEKLSVKNLFVNGFVNGIDIPTLNKYTLKLNEDQEITQGYQFEFLNVNNINLNNIEGVTTSDLILIDQDRELLGLDLNTDLIVDKLQITNKLNDINVKNGQLDVLLIDSNELQHISGLLQLDHLTLMSRINLRAHFNSSEFERINPMKTIDEDIEIVGNYTISGNVNVEEMLQSEDLQGKSGYTFNKLLNHGVRLTDTQIPIHLDFSQHINAEDIFVDKINEKEINLFIITGTNQTHVISGWKEFPNMQITGSTNLFNVNRINVQDLEQNVLKIHGDQIVTGRQIFENVVANRITNVRTQFGNRQWNEVVNVENIQHIEGKTIVLNDVNVESLKTSSLIIKSTLNNYDFDRIVTDTIFSNNTKSISGHKHFSNLTINNITLNRQIDLDDIPNKIKNAYDIFIFDGDLILSEQIEINKIFFNGKINNVSSQDFDELLKDSTDHVIRDNQNYSSITIHGNVTIASGLLGKINIENCVKDTVKIDEFHHFHKAEFVNDLIVLTPVIVNGIVEAIKLEDIIRSQNEQQIIESIQIEQLNVEGFMDFKQKVSGVNLSDVCSLLSPLGIRNLVVNGSAFFAKGPEIQSINGLKLEDINKNAWFSDKECVIEGSPQFQNMIFKKPVTVQGYVDGILLSLLEKTYLSKTKNQTISAYLELSKTVLFKNGLSALDDVILTDSISGINLNEFMGTAILQGYDQLFENILYVDSCQSTQVSGEFLVNNLNLQTDVMLYNTKNIVVGKKTLLGLNANELHFDKDIFIQNINIFQWLKDSVLTTGTFALKQMNFYGHTNFSSSLSSQNLVNNMRFDDKNILLKSIEQNVSGRKRFSGNEVKFKEMKIKDNLNNINITQLFQSLVYMNDNATFTNSVHFTNNLQANNINIKQLYQGINVTALILNLTKFSLSSDYDYHYGYLLNVSKRAMESLKDHAFYFDSYKTRQTYITDALIPIKITNEQHLIQIIKTDMGVLIEIHLWDEIQQYFHNDPVYPRSEFDGNFRYGKMIGFEKEFFYVEHEISKNQYGSNLFLIQKDGLHDYIIPFIHNGSQNVESVFLQNKRCLLLTHLVNDTDLYCETLTDKGLTMTFYTKFPAENVIKAKYLLISGVPHVFILHSEDFLQGSTLTIWKFDKSSNIFKINQKIYLMGPISFSIIYYKGDYFLAITTGKVYNAIHSGLVDIRKYNRINQEFISWQEISLSSPNLIEFAILPSNELFLYVTTENPSAPLIIFDYEGISGFVKKITASTLPLLDNLSQCSVGKQHFLIAKSQKEIRIIQTIFKG